MYGCELDYKAERRRIDAFELWCWRRLLRVHWTARRSIQSILKEISPGCSLEGLMLKLKLQYFGQLLWRDLDEETFSLEKTLMLGKIEGRRRRGWQRMRWLDGMTDLMDMNLSKLWEFTWWTGRPGVLQSMGSQRVRHWGVALNWTESSLEWIEIFHNKKQTITMNRGFPGSSDGKESACNAGDQVSILGLWRSPGEGSGSPLHYSCLQNATGRGAWQATGHEVAKSRTQQWLTLPTSNNEIMLPRERTLLIL